MSKVQVLIVGAGFGGLNVAKKLGHRKDVDVTIFDSRNYHLFQPLLYQVATAGLSPAEIAAPIRNIVSRYRNIHVRMGKVDQVDLNEKTISVEGKAYPYDYLVLACGSQHSYFGHDEWEDFAPGLKTLEQATEIRRRVLLAFEHAEKETNPETQKKLLTFVIIGAGPTGVEIAGAISEISRFTLERDFRHIDPSRTRIILIEAGKRILAGFAEDLSKKAERDLEKMGVQIWTNTRVTKVEEGTVSLGDERIAAQTVIWAAGVKPAALNAKLDVRKDAAGRIEVRKDLAIPQYPNVFVVGDQAHFEQDGKALPGLAPVAMQQGRQAAANIVRLIKGRPTEGFHYFDKGQMATIGRSRAILQLGSLHMSGLLAWLAWLFVHIYYLIGFKNRIFVLYQWAWAYLTYRRGARLIVDKDWKNKN